MRTLGIVLCSISIVGNILQLWPWALERVIDVVIAIYDVFDPL